MKKVFQLFVWLIVMLLIIILIKTLLFKSLQIKTEPVSITSYGTESVDRLSKAIRFPTISYSEDSPIDSASFGAYHNFIDESYPLIKSKLQKEVFNKFSLLYTWKGKNPSLKPMILMAHMDVVPPGDTTRWERSPFSGYNDGTFIWGRGTLDDKVAMISIFEAVEKLLSEGFEPERTLMLSFGHDEELSGKRGAKTIASSLKEHAVEVEFVLDEGLAVTKGMVPMIKKPVALIGTSEKGLQYVNLVVDMPGGQSSIPEKESSLTVLSKAINNIVKKQMKPSISGSVNDFIRYIGPEMPFYAKAIFANKWLFKRIILKIYTGSASGNALVRTTTAPTFFNAGVKNNVIPTEAKAVVNFRILPGETSADVTDHLLKVVADKRVRIETIKELTYEPSPVSPLTVPGFKNIFITLRQIYPETAVAPNIMLASSDGKFFSAVTNNIYRFSPIVVNSDDMARIHGLNERTKIEDYNKGIGFYYQLIRNSQER